MILNLFTEILSFTKGISCHGNRSRWNLYVWRIRYQQVINIYRGVKLKYGNKCVSLILFYLEISSIIPLMCIQLLITDPFLFLSGSLLGDLWLLRGDSWTAERSVTVECPRSFTNFILAHGCLMVIGWGIFVVWGAYIARYFKSSGDTWFYLHLILQV